MKVSLKTISEITGFSQATISNALHNKRGVNPKTAEQILKVAQEYGYIQEKRITNIKVVTYRDSGGVFSDTPFFSILMESVENEAHKCGYTTSIYNLYRHSEDYQERLQSLLEDTNSAILLIGTELQEEDAAVFQDWPGELLLLDTKFDHLAFNAVLMNNESSSRQATEYLIGKGHRKIGYLKGAVRILNFVRRCRGFQQVMQENGLDGDEFVITVGPSIVDSYKAMQEYVAAKKPLPTAFFADNDMIALGAMKALQEGGYKVPEDISIIGFDDIPFCEAFNPGLTTMKVHNKELGEVAVHMLVELIDNNGNDGLCRCTEIYNELIERGSVASPKAEK